jgi:hypothetical protein
MSHLADKPPVFVCPSSDKSWFYYVSCSQIGKQVRGRRPTQEEAMAEAEKWQRTFGCPDHGCAETVAVLTEPVFD